MYSFGSGVLIGTRTDIANATPVNFGLVQEVTLDETASVKELFGQFQRPLALARGTIKTSGKAKVARISGLAFANLYYGATPVAGQTATSFAEAGTVAASSPYVVTVANAATFVGDEGVVYAASGLPLTKVATSPAAGQYSVAAGVYTFDATDAGKAVLDLELGRLDERLEADQPQARELHEPALLSLPRRGRDKHARTPSALGVR